MDSIFIFVHRPDEISATEISLGRQSSQSPDSPGCRLSLRAGSHRVYSPTRRARVYKPEAAPVVER